MSRALPLAPSPSSTPLSDTLEIDERGLRLDPDVIVSISAGVILLVAIAFILTVIATYGLHYRMLKRKRRLQQAPPTDTALSTTVPTYDDILTLPERTQHEDDGFIVNPNDAYSLRSRDCKTSNMELGSISNNQGDRAQSVRNTCLCSTNQTVQLQPTSHICLELDTQGCSNGEPAISLRKNATVHAYENVRLSGKLFGEYVQPEFCGISTTTSLANFSVCKVTYSDISTSFKMGKSSSVGDMAGVLVQKTFRKPVPKKRSITQV